MRVSIFELSLPKLEKNDVGCLIRDVERFQRGIQSVKGNYAYFSSFGL